MITAAGCAARCARVLTRLQPEGPLLFADPLHLRYLAGLYVDPFSLGADYGAVLVLNPDGVTQLYHDHRLPKPSVEAAFANEKDPVPWYDGISPGDGPRRMILRKVVDDHGGRVHDGLADEEAPLFHALISDLRRAKDDDEVATIEACCRAGEAGMAWARANAKPGMTELDVYLGVFDACTHAAGKAVIIYGDFAVSPGSAKRGGPPSNHVIAAGETLILDYSVILAGYRSDFTNTLVVGAKPTAAQQELFDLSLKAMMEGERHLRAGVRGKEVYYAVRNVFADAGKADNFPHHAGHGLGLAHPEAPFLVKQSLETLVAGDVVTLEPGLYVDGVGGVRIEHNYLITESGFEQLSKHELGL